MVSSWRSFSRFGIWTRYEIDFQFEELCSICVAVCKEELMLTVSFWELQLPTLFMSWVNIGLKKINQKSFLVGSRLLSVLIYDSESMAENPCFHVFGDLLMIRQVGFLTFFLIRISPVLSKKKGVHISSESPVRNWIKKSKNNISVLLQTAVDRFCIYLCCYCCCLGTMG